jgi:hypothetical protein
MLLYFSIIALFIFCEATARHHSKKVASLDDFLGVANQKFNKDSFPDTLAPNVDPEEAKAEHSRRSKISKKRKIRQNKWNDVKDVHKMIRTLEKVLELAKEDLRL